MLFFRFAFRLFFLFQWFFTSIYSEFSFRFGHMLCRLLLANRYFYISDVESIIGRTKYASLASISFLVCVYGSIIITAFSGFTEHYLYILITLPLLAFIFVLGSDSDECSKYLTFFFSVVIFIVTSFIGIQLLEPDSFGFHVILELFKVEFLGLCVHVGCDNISFMFIYLTSFLICSISLSSWSNTSRFTSFGLLLLLAEFLLFLIFLVMDVFGFFIVYEAVVVPVFFIIGLWGGRAQRVYAAYLFFYYTFAGSFSMLLSIMYVYMAVGSTSYLAILNFEFNNFEEVVLFFTFFLAFAAKLPLYPLHSWLPEAHVEAPTSGSMLLAGILLKMGGYGVIRWCLGVFPFAFAYFSNLAIMVALVSIFYSSISALQQFDIKRIIAYSSIAHMSYSILGLFTLSSDGIAGFMFLMVSHGLISSALFFCVGVLYDRYGSRSILVYGGLAPFMPIFDSVFFFFCVWLI